MSVSVSTKKKTWGQVLSHVSQRKRNCLRFFLKASTQIIRVRSSRWLQRPLWCTCRPQDRSVDEMTPASHLSLRAATVKHTTHTQVQIQYHYIVISSIMLEPLEWSLPGKTSGSSSPRPAGGPPWTWTGEQIMAVSQASATVKSQAYNKVQITSFQINLGCQGFHRLGLHRTNWCMYVIYVFKNKSPSTCLKLQ